MTKVVFDISMSLDGYITGSPQTPEEPLGEGAEQHLHGWYHAGDETSRDVAGRYVDSIGALICGRRSYEHSLPWWGADGPHPPRPVFVVTHQAPAQSPAGGVYRFITGGIESALEQAQAAAGDKIVAVMGGADVGRQFIAAGLVDEVSFHLVPVLLGSGTRMFEGVHKGHVRLEVVDVVPAPAATHLRYRVVR